MDYITLAFVGSIAVGLIIYLRVLGKMPNLRILFKQINQKTNSKIPEEWLKDKSNISKHSKTGLVTVQFEKGRKIRLPGLRTSKRLLAAFMLVSNFVIAQTALTSATASQPLAILFYANCFIALDYLWKTRRKRVAWGK